MRSRIISISVFGMVSVLLLGCQMSQDGAKAGEEEKWRRASLNEWGPDKETHDPKLLPVTHFASAQLLEKGGRLVEAARQYELAIALNHDFAEAYNRLGMVLGRLGRHEQADAALQQAVRLRPDNGTYVNNLGFSYLLQRRYGDAEQMFSEALLIDPGIVLARMNLAIALANQGMYEDSLYHFRQVLPEADAQYNIGLFCLNAGMLDAADRHFRMACTADPAHHAALRQIEELGPRLAWRQSAEEKSTLEQSLFSRPVSEGRIAQVPEPQSPVPMTPSPAATSPETPAKPVLTSKVQTVQTAQTDRRPSPVPVPQPRQEQITVITLDSTSEPAAVGSTGSTETPTVVAARRELPTPMSRIDTLAEPCDEEYIEEEDIEDEEIDGSDTSSSGWHLTSVTPVRIESESTATTNNDGTDESHSWFDGGDETIEPDEDSDGWTRAPAVMPERTWDEETTAPIASSSIATETSNTSTPTIVSVPAIRPIETRPISPAPATEQQTQRTPPRPSAIPAPATTGVSEIYEFDGNSGTLRLISNGSGTAAPKARTIRPETPAHHEIKDRPVSSKIAEEGGAIEIRRAEPASFAMMSRTGGWDTAHEVMTPESDALESDACTRLWLREIGQGMRAAAVSAPKDDDVSSDFIVTAHVD